MGWDWQHQGSYNITHMYIWKPYLLSVYLSDIYWATPVSTAASLDRHVNKKNKISAFTPVTL